MCNSFDGPHHHWLSYGGGRNSTALMVLLCEGRLPEYEPWTAIFADTGCEKDETLAYVIHVVEPYLARHGRKLVTVRPDLTVLERWEKWSVTGSRIVRSCTEHAKIVPIGRHLKATGQPLVRLIGIDAGEQHRARTHPRDEWPKRWPLIERTINLRGCLKVIADAGLCPPVKSGCWCCPFMRVSEVLALAREHPDRFARIERLEEASLAAHPLPPGKTRAQWHDRPARWWRERAEREAQNVQGTIPGLDIEDPEMPCGCWDGHDEVMA